MKKWFILGFLFFLVECSTTTDGLKDTSDLQAALEEKECWEIDYRNSCQFDFVPYLGFDPYLADNVVAKEKENKTNEEVLTDNSTYQTVLIDGLYISIKEGNLTYVDVRTGDMAEYNEVSDFKVMAITSDCGGGHEIYALTETAEVYNIEAYRQISNIEGNQIVFSVEPLNLDEKVSGLAVKEYGKIGSTCGSMAVYVVDEQGVEYTILRKTDENEKYTYQIGEATRDTAYTSYISLSEVSDDGTTEYPVNYLLLMLNKTVRLAKRDEFDGITLQDILEDENGNPILAKEILAQPKGNANAAYLLSEDGLLYFYDEALSVVGSWEQKESEYTLILDDGEVLEVSK